jgi:hypothetical protein
MASKRSSAAVDARPFIDPGHSVGPSVPGKQEQQAVMWCGAVGLQQQGRCSSGGGTAGTRGESTGRHTSTHATTKLNVWLMSLQQLQNMQL